MFYIIFWNVIMLCLESPFFEYKKMHWFNSIINLFNLIVDVPPSIIYSVVDGNYGVDPQGRLVLVPGSIVHFDCIFPRQNGNPKWTWTNSNSQRQGIINILLFVFLVCFTYLSVTLIHAFDIENRFNTWEKIFFITFIWAFCNFWPDNHSIMTNSIVG